MELKNDLSLQLIEYSPEWENTSKNLKFLTEILNIPTQADIVILPEMFNTGFSKNTAKTAESVDGKTISWMKEFSLKKQKAICGSLTIKENRNFYNRFVFISNGEIRAYYNKRHLFTYGGENESFKPGNKKVVFEYLGWNICPMICYDLRFPVWMRNTENYDLIINTANWPSSRIKVWDTLLKARAIENMSYVCGINRIGKDGNKLTYNGHSSVISPIGKKIQPLHSSNFSSEIYISLSEMKRWRNEYCFLEDRDNFVIL